MEEEPLTKLVIGSAMKVHSALGPGFLESVYHNALAHELAKDGMQFESARAITVHYDGIIVGNFIADLVVENRVLLELKACLSLVPAHEVQLVNLPHCDRN